MSALIHKIPLGGGVGEIYLDDGDANDRIIHAAQQRNDICIWVERSTEKTGDRLAVNVVVTGAEVNLDRWEHVTTVLMLGGDFVVHIYRERVS